MSTPQKTLVLIHGMGRFHWSMAHLIPIAKRKGYSVVNFSYHPRDGSIRDIARNLGGRLEKEIITGTSLAFITHSLGSIIFRYYLSDYVRPDSNTSIRAVMLGPPNQGSLMARKLMSWNFFIKRFGAPFEELSRGDFPSLPSYAEVGIIAGIISSRFSLHPFHREANDSIVSLSETRLEGARDHRIIRCPHAVLMYSPAALKNIFYFLEHGSFPERRKD